MKAKKSIKRRETLSFYMGLLVIFGLNGYFDFCCMHNHFIDVVGLSMIYVRVVIFTSPAFFLQKIQQIKIRKKEIIYEECKKK